jgi:hypothetical protein
MARVWHVRTARIRHLTRAFASITVLVVARYDVGQAEAAW